MNQLTTTHTPEPSTPDTSVLVQQTTEGLELRNKIEELKTLLLSRHPQMPILLREIHRTLKTYPEQVTLLQESEICAIVDGLKIQTGIEFSASKAKESTTKTASAKIKHDPAAALGL